MFITLLIHENFDISAKFKNYKNSVNIISLCLKNSFSKFLDFKSCTDFDLFVISVSSKRNYLKIYSEEDNFFYDSILIFKYININLISKNIYN